MIIHNSFGSFIICSYLLVKNFSYFSGRDLKNLCLLKVSEFHHHYEIHLEDNSDLSIHLEMENSVKDYILSVMVRYL